MLKRFFTRKHRGNGDLIASLFVIAALTLFCFYFINVINDVDTKIQIDQVARKYILRMESSGELTTSEKTSLINDLNNISAVKKATDAGNPIVVTWNTTNTKKSYGDTVTLHIECPVYTTAYDPSSGTFGVLNRNTLTVFKINKQSTAKY